MSSVSYDTYKVVHDQYQNEMKQFLDVVFQRVYSDKFMQIFKEVMASKADNGMDVYRELLRRAPEAQGGTYWSLKTGLKSLKEERGTLADNIEKISDPLYTREGYLEINLPFRMGASVRKAMGVTGKSALVNDQERPGDILQCGFPRPYSVFIPYGDDAPLKKEDYPFPISVIGMFAGAHHCKEKNLKTYFQSIYDVLQPGGIFLLRDHDAGSDKQKAIADMAHRFFNALTSVSDKDEEAEIRHFQSLSHFIQAAQEVGFKVASDPLIRDGDTTLNALVKFYKPHEGESQAQVGFIREKMINTCRQRPSTKSYFRDEKQTHLTKVEWLNVEQEMAQASFCKKNFFINYPYGRDAAESVSVFNQSFKAACDKKSFKDVFLSDYTLMNSTITICTAMQNVVKSIFYTPASLLSKLGGCLPHQENPNWEKPSEYYGEWLEKYSNSLEVIPSYEHPFYQNLKGYFSVLQDSFAKARETQSLPSLLVDKQTIKNITTGVAMTADLLWRQLFASSVKAFYGGQDNADAREIGLIINTKGKTNPFEGCENQVKAVVEENGNPYKGIIVPRYKELTQVLEILAKHDIEIMEIAGQSAIEIEFVVDANGKLPEMDGVKELYRRRNYLDGSKQIAACIVPINNIHNVLKEHSGLIHRIYDF